MFEWRIALVHRNYLTFYLVAQSTSVSTRPEVNQFNHGNTTVGGLIVSNDFVRSRDAIQTTAKTKV